MCDPLFISATVEACNFKFGTQVGLVVQLTKKQLLGPKLAGFRARGTFKKNGTPVFILQSLKLASSNLVHKLGLLCSLPRNNFQDQNWQGFGLGEHSKKWDPRIYFAVIEASKFKFAIQLGLGQQLTKKQLFGRLGYGALKKFWTPYFFLQPLKLATSNLVHNFSLENMLQ